MSQDKKTKKCPSSTQEPENQIRPDSGQDSANRGRRRLVKSAVAGGSTAVVAHGLPLQWKTPLIESVVLPAHAQTSSDSGSDDSGGSSSSPGVTVRTGPECTFAGDNLITFSSIRPSTINGSYNLTNFGSQDFVIGDVSISTPANVSGTFMPTPSGTLTMNVSPGSLFMVEWVATSGCTTSNGAAVIRIGLYPSGGDISDQEFCEFPVTLNCASTSTTGNAGNASDMRLKTDIRRLVTAPNGHQLYQFQYKGDPLKKNFVGVMAQDLITSHPQALTRRSDGYFLVRYDLLGLRMVSLEEWNQSGMDSVMLPN